MTPDEIRQLILEVLQEQSISSLNTPNHQHTGIDSPKVLLTDLLIVPQSAITADVGGTAGATYTATEQALINNHETRINEIYLRLQNLNLLK